MLNKSSHLDVSFDAIQKDEKLRNLYTISRKLMTEAFLSKEPFYMRDRWNQIYLAVLKGYSDAMDEVLK